MIVRELQQIIEQRLFKGKAIIVLGPRQTGKTTLLKQIVQIQEINYLWLDSDDPSVRAQHVQNNVAHLQRLLGQHKIVVVDEAQQVQNIGISLKLIVDHIPGTQLLVSGSSALELAAGFHEPLTGRKYEYQLFPLSFNELQTHYGWLKEQSLLKQRLVFDSYPEVVTKPHEMRDHLAMLAGSYLYKDIFKYKDIRRPELLEQLLQLLALQFGSQVSYNELAQQLGADTETVQRYINMLEHTFVDFRLRDFSHNLRNEIKKSRKIYFYDNGIRNALINNFSPMSLQAIKVHCGRTILLPNASNTINARASMPIAIIGVHISSRKSIISKKRPECSMLLSSSGQKKQKRKYRLPLRRLMLTVNLNL